MKDKDLLRTDGDSQRVSQGWGYVVTHVVKSFFVGDTAWLGYLLGYLLVSSLGEVVEAQILQTKTDRYQITGGLDIVPSYANETAFHLSVNAFSVLGPASVGIGTAQPEDKLHIMGGGIKLEDPFVGSVCMRTFGISDKPSFALGFDDRNGTALVEPFKFDSDGGFQLGSSGSGALFVGKSDGLVGIGTQYPVHSLDVQAHQDGLTFVRVMNENPGVSAAAGFQISQRNTADTSTFNVTLTIGADEIFQIQHGTLGISIDKFGNVGIKTSSPGYTLDVAGDINFSGKLYRQGLFFTGGTGGGLVQDSCLTLQAAGRSTGEYWIDPDGPGGVPAFKAYCDMDSDGGGWTLAVVIDGNDEDHGIPGQVGTLPILPTDITTKKLDDDTIRSLISPQSVAQIKFVCDGYPHFFKDCKWRATKGLPSNSDPCVVSYTDEAATMLQNDVACNMGSGALGSHCISSSPAAHTYCSHCDYADGAYSAGGYIPGGVDDWHNRKGCGHDATGYSKPGFVWIR